jgi:Flp pilus assembly protein TadB
VNKLRLVLAISGFVLAVIGVTLDDIRLVWGAIAVLLASLLFRLLLHKRVNGNSKPEG